MGRLFLLLLRQLFSKAVLYLVLLSVAVVMYLAYQAGVRFEKEQAANIEAGEMRLQQWQNELGQAQQLANKAQHEVNARLQELDQSKQELDGFRDLLKKVWMAVQFRSEEYQQQLRDKEQQVAEREKRLQEAQAIKEQFSKQLENFHQHPQRIFEQEQQLQKWKTDLKQHQETRERYLGPIKNAFWAVFWPVFFIFLSLTLGPVFWRIVLYYVWAPMAQRAKPVVLQTREESQVPLLWSDSAPSLEHHLQAGQRLWIKTRYLQSSEDPMIKETRLLWSWRFPATSLGAQLYALTSLRLPKNEATEIQRVTISDMEDGMREMVRVTLHAGQSLCFRPSYLAGIAFQEGQEPQLKTVWRLFSMHAWMTWQWRYFIMDGPCVIYFAAGRGAKAEPVRAPIDGQSGRRVNQDLCIAFEPHLNYSSRRAETALAGYLLGKNPLFDDWFQGQGTLAVQQVMSEKDRNEFKISTFWEKILGGVGKLFGL